MKKLLLYCLIFAMSAIPVVANEMVDDYMEIGYITHKKIVPGRFANLYIEALKRYTRGMLKTEQ